MSKRGNDGKRIWRERGPLLSREISEQISSASTQQMDTWVRDGRMPRWIRVKAWLQRRPLDVRGGDDSR